MQSCSIPVLLVLATAVLAACSRDETPAGAPGAALKADPQAEEKMASIRHGGDLYLQHCAQCHGPRAQGHPDWENASADYVAAPPLNGEGSVPKRKRVELVAVIKNGITKKGEAVMPAWKDRLSDSDVDAIVNWFVALWPDAIYEAWKKSNEAPASKT
jgi:mono/diheme cytochrome c family protein